MATGDGQTMAAATIGRIGGSLAATPRDGGASQSLATTAQATEGSEERLSQSHQQQQQSSPLSDASLHPAEPPRTVTSARAEGAAKKAEPPPAPRRQPSTQHDEAGVSSDRQKSASSQTEQLSSTPGRSNSSARTRAVALPKHVRDELAAKAQRLKVALEALNKRRQRRRKEAPPAVAETQRETAMQSQPVELKPPPGDAPLRVIRSERPSTPAPSHANYATECVAAHPRGRHAIVTLATGDASARMATVLLQTLRDVGTCASIDVVVLVAGGGMGSADCVNGAVSGYRRPRCRSPNITDPHVAVSSVYLDSWKDLGARVEVVAPVAGDSSTFLCSTLLLPHTDTQTQVNGSHHLSVPPILFGFGNDCGEDSRRAASTLIAL